MDHDSVRPYLWMLAGTFAFASMGVLAGQAGRACDWQLVAVARSAIPLVLIGSYALATRVPLVMWRPGILWMRSLAGSVSLIGTFYALSRLPTSDVFTLTNIFPIWVALLSWPMLGEWPSLQVWLSVVSGVLGVALIQQPHLAAGNSAVFVALSVSLFTALAMIGLHRLKGLDPLAIVVHFSMVSLVFALAACFLFERHKPLEAAFESDVVWKLIGVGVMASFGQLCLTLAFTYGEPAKISVVGLAQIVFSLILDAVLFGNAPEPIKFVGIPLVMAPTGWLMWNQKAMSGGD